MRQLNVLTLFSILILFQSCKYFCPDPPKQAQEKDSFGEELPEWFIENEEIQIDSVTINIATTECDVSLHIQTRKIKRDPNNNVIIGFEWKDIPITGNKTSIPVGEAVRTYAELNNGCLAKISINKSGELNNLIFSNGTPMPNANTCTLFKEMIWWIRRAQNNPPGFITPKFTVTANCEPCETCSGSDSDGKEIK